MKILKVVFYPLYTNCARGFTGALDWGWVGYVACRFEEMAIFPLTIYTIFLSISENLKVPEIAKVVSLILILMSLGWMSNVNLKK